MSGKGLRFHRRTILKASLAACACCMPRGTQANDFEYRLAPQQIGDGVWMVSGALEYFSQQNGGNIVNTVFVDAPDGVIVIDTGPSLGYGQALANLISQTIPGKKVIRVFNTHHHPDHIFGNGAFGSGVVAATQDAAANINATGEALSDNMYRILGDWMQGTELVAPSIIIRGDKENIGGRTFSYFPLSGHTSADLAIRDDKTGTLFVGDLVFYDRTPTTPNADIEAWKTSLATMATIDHSLLVPGHGPKDNEGKAIAQTGGYLDWLLNTLREAATAGLTMNEAMTLDMPAPFSTMAVAREEYQRSVMHLYPGVEASVWDAVTPDRS